jgi:hypothetical protein
MGVGKTERASLHDSRFTIGRRSDAANDRIIRNLKIKGGRIRKIGDKWTIVPAATTTISPGVGYPSAWDIEFLYSGGAQTGDVLVKNPAIVLGGRAVVIATSQEFTVTPTSPNLYLWGTFDTVDLSYDGFVVNNSGFDCELNSGSTPGSMRSPSNTKAYMLLYRFQIIEGVLSVKCDYRNTPTIGIF